MEGEGIGIGMQKKGLFLKNKIKKNDLSKIILKIKIKIFSSTFWKYVSIISALVPSI